MVMGPPPCSGRPRAYEGAWRCLGFSLFPPTLTSEKPCGNISARNSTFTCPPAVLSSVEPTWRGLYWFIL